MLGPVVEFLNWLEKSIYPNLATFSLHATSYLKIGFCNSSRIMRIILIKKLKPQI